MNDVRGEQITENNTKKFWVANYYKTTKGIRANYT